MKWTEIKDKTAAELEELLTASRAEMVNLRFRAGSGALQQVHQIAKSRKTIARLLTKLNQLKNPQA